MALIIVTFGAYLYFLWKSGTNFLCPANGILLVCVYRKTALSLTFLEAWKQVPIIAGAYLYLHMSS